MNELRKLPEIGGDQVDCVDNYQLSEVLGQIVVGVNTVNEFFDVKSYDINKSNFATETYYTETILNPRHGILKQYFIEK